MRLNKFSSLANISANGPQMVYYKFRQSMVVARFSFRNRREKINGYNLMICYEPEELAVPVHHYSVTLAAFTLMFHPLLVESCRQWSECCLTYLLLVQL